MIEVDKHEFKPGTKEELLPEFDESFPCISTVYRLLPGRKSPWHWHGEAELFYIEGGELEYSVPSGNYLFKDGEGGFVRCGVLHSSLVKKGGGRQLLHIFDPLLISGHRGSRIERRVVAPLLCCGAEIIRLDPAVPRQRELLERLKRSFELSGDDAAYELRLRAELSELWLGLLELASFGPEREKTPASSERLKQMMVYIHENCGSKLCTAEIARAAGVSERSAFELFRSCLRTSPMEYLKDYRVTRACALLSDSELGATEIAEACGLGGGSYFARVFREKTGMTPMEYRRKHKGKPKK